LTGMTLRIDPDTRRAAHPAKTMLSLFALRVKRETD
jgi:hypothetical protein